MLQQNHIDKKYKTLWESFKENGYIDSVIYIYISKCNMVNYLVSLVYIRKAMQNVKNLARNITYYV